ncbi:chromosome segregation protein SMC [Agathobaculum sp.]|uniref:chromosome segregation protein SMC n=1 Tax=Agathobaculum sp. TaxID=2048138 RepID=UPI002A8023E7|nr:chromosome segregation protein SMC [Agathobaculum sp.]MDY3618581.1 chromosome segregation protein SMC [Agathobaculum sp.]
MVLKSLILQGFKSFPDKTEIQFLGGLTAIVGPNGSGKSNISDAIRWVLGEQSSRSLRGAKMEDVIFGGTAKRGPVGFAEVSLILDNSEGAFRSAYTDIMVTRRYYRSGESEYYINRVHCRLKDIHELFMDTGLGRDGYSIIGQGRIDEILSLKSEDRREIFEEAAGITKFRYRKEEAERKLTATEDNLTRIRDLYAELERQVGPLAKQAEKAREYLLLRDELRVLEISLWLLGLQKLKEDEEKTENDAAVCAQQLDEARAAQDGLYARSEQLAGDMREIDREADRLRQQLRETEQRVAEQASRAAVLRANIQNNRDNIERARHESTQRAEQAQSLGAQLAARESRIELLGAQLEGLLAKQEAGKQEAEKAGESRAGAEQALREAQAERKDRQDALHRLALDRTAAETGLQSCDGRHDTIAADISAAETRLAAEKQAHAALEEQMRACLDTLAGAKNKAQGVALKADSRRKKVEALSNELARATAALTDAKNRVKMLSDMQKDYEGFSRSVKTIMQRAESGAQKGVHGPVSSLLDVPEQFVTAIDTALGASASSIVVDTAASGKACIEYLKRADGGRATFLPIDIIKPQQLRETGLENRPGCFGTADRLVSCGSQYTAIVQNLLARTVIAESMDAALALAKAYGHRFRIVTLDGQILQAGGAMTGGSASRGTGALARAGKLKAMREQVSELEQKQQQAERDCLAAKEELAALDYDLKAIEAERARAEQDEAGLRASVSQHGALLESLTVQFDGLTLERDNLSAAKQQYLDTIAACKARQTEAQAALDAADERVGACQNKLEELAVVLNETMRLEAALQTEIAENRSEAASEARARDDLERLKKELDAGVTGTDEAIAGFEAEIGRLEAELAHAESSKEDTGAVSTKLSEQLAAQVNQRERVEGERAAVDRQAQGKTEEILNLEREAARLENKAAQLKNEQTQILDKMWESYELTPTPAAEAAKELPDVPAAREKAQNLRARMKTLGNVNLDAVDEYKEALERYTFLGGQKDDLEKAQKELYKVIEQLTQNMKEIFASEFAKLNAYFGETFREIFGGGHAELQLADTSDILNCGIDIRVSPPGKAVKTLTLLSGGEKAFVAIALYFAILKLRPTPFCVLDEIEAALDDVNVVRYAQYIRRLADKTQFIVITHRRGTMEEADMLYGVTMQEQGVSKLLMLNLAEAEKRLGSTIR